MGISMTVKDLLKEIEYNNKSLKNCLYWSQLKRKFIKPPKKDLPYLVWDFTKAVAECKNVSPEELLTSSRNVPYPYIRNCIWYLLRKYYEKSVSLATIAKCFNRKSHGNIIHGIENISAWLKTDKSIQEDINTFEQLLLNKGVITEILPYYERKPNKYKWLQKPEHWN